MHYVNPHKRILKNKVVTVKKHARGRHPNSLSNLKKFTKVNVPNVALLPTTNSSTAMLAKRRNFKVHDYKVPTYKLKPDS